MWLVRIIFWLQAFISPAVFFTLLALWMYSNGEQYAVPAIVLLATGIITGVIVAEYIRRKYGLENFFGRTYGTDKEDEKNENS